VYSTSKRSLRGRHAEVTVLKVPLEAQEWALTVHATSVALEDAWQHRSTLKHSKTPAAPATACVCNADGPGILRNTCDSSQCAC
jgi:pyruvate formate-lyase activating enzyme-like uncharacterized protein